VIVSNRRCVMSREMMPIETARRDLAEYLTVAEVAQRLGVSRQAVEKAIRDGKLQAVEAFGIRLVNEWWLLDYEDARSGKVAPTQPEEPEEPVQVAPTQLVARPAAAPLLSLGRTAPPALQNSRVQPRPKEAWVKKVTHARAHEGTV
jgi:excisionase family DNA binding protein